MGSRPSADTLSVCTYSAFEEHSKVTKALEVDVPEVRYVGNRLIQTEFACASIIPHDVGVSSGDYLDWIDSQQPRRKHTALLRQWLEALPSIIKPWCTYRRDHHPPSRVRDRLAGARLIPGSALAKTL